MNGGDEMSSEVVSDTLASDISMLALSVFAAFMLALVALAALVMSVMVFISSIKDLKRRP